MDQDLETSLKSSEWVILLTFSLIFSSLLLFTYLKTSKLSSYFSAESNQEQERLEVVVLGAVAKPGVYHAHPGDPLGEIIKKSKPKKLADLSLIDLLKKIEEPLEVIVLEKKEISIWLSKNGETFFEFKIPIGTRFSDLKSKIDVDCEDHLSLFKSRRLLKDGERISLVKESG